MSLYSFHKIQDSVLNEIKSKNLILTQYSNLGKILKYLTIENLVSEKLVDCVYLNPNLAPCFLDVSTVRKIEDKIKEKFDETIDFDKITQVNSAHNNNDFQRFKIAKIEDYKILLDSFINNSSYGEQFLKEKEEKKIIAEKNQKAHMEAMQKIKKEKREEFNNQSDLTVNFNDKNIACIDLEFFIHKGNMNKRREHDITEVGISYRNGNVKHNEHFLVQEHYEKKKNRAKQERFAFGKTHVLTEDGIKKYLNVFLKKVDFLLFHQSREDLSALKQIGVDIVKDYPQIQIIDTQAMYKRYFASRNKETNMVEGESLDTLLGAFGVKCESQLLHNGGNDAEYTMQLLFAMQKKFAQNFENTRRNNGSVKEIETSVDQELKAAMQIIKKHAEQRGVSEVDLVSSYVNQENKIEKEKRPLTLCKPK